MNGRRISRFFHIYWKNLVQLVGTVLFIALVLGAVTGPSILVGIGTYQFFLPRMGENFASGSSAIGAIIALVLTIVAVYSYAQEAEQ